MIVWRLTMSARKDAAFDGEGARLYGGRWNRTGTSLVYAATHASLAIVEVLVHVEAEDLHRPLYLYRVAVPDDAASRLERADLPRDWRALPAPASTAELGSRWAEGRASVALVVPSAIVPQEENVLLNPRHPRFGELEIGSAERFQLDPRLVDREGR
jgi:RES domain-containing protein